ncbi:MAG: alpha/beta fold hydrolase [Caldilineaceae bacterium]
MTAMIAITTTTMMVSQPPLLEKRQIRVGSAWVRYEMAGAGPPLILVHGLAGSTRWWRHNIWALARHFQVYAVDLSEFGDRRLRPRFVLSQAAYYLGQWLTALGIARATLIGHSMGGRIVAEFAAEYPQRVDRLVLVSAPIVPFGHGYLHQIGGMVLALWRIQLSFLLVLLYDTLYTGIIPVLRVGQELLHSDLQARLADLQAPTLIIWGEQDTIVPLRLGHALHQQLACSEFALIEGAAHVPMWERPEEFNRLVLAFLLG